MNAVAEYVSWVWMGAFWLSAWLSWARRIWRTRDGGPVHAAQLGFQRIERELWPFAPPGMILMDLHSHNPPAFLACDAAIWLIAHYFRDDDDDNPWRRRRKKAADAVKLFARKLIVRPA